MVEETGFHILFNCQFALAVYQASPILIEIQGENIMQTVEHWVSYQDQGIMLNLGSCLMWNIWKSINDPIFNNTQALIDVCIRKSLGDFKSFDLHHALNYCSGINVSNSVVAVWELPPFSYVKINVDAAFYNGKGTVAAVDVDSNGSHLGSGALCFDTFSATIAEAKAYGFGIQFAKRLQLSRVIMEGDTYEIPKPITGNTNTIPWSIRSTVLSIRDRVKEFRDISFESVPRDANSIAHDLVQYTNSNYLN